MPKMDGWEMRSRVKTDLATQNIPVVALSAHAMAGDKERALKAGFDGYLTKPVNVATILKDICNTLQENRKNGNGSKPTASDTPAPPAQ
jgi:CheY-like chemotaxis protein